MKLLIDNSISLETIKQQNEAILPPSTIRGVKCPSKKTFQSSETRSCIGIDWLTISVKGLAPLDSLKGNFFFEIDPNFYASKYWRKIYKVTTFLNNDSLTPEVFGFLETENTEQRTQHWNFKIHNRFLYTKDFSYWVELALKELRLQFLAISRIDLAADFQNWKAPVSPERFVTKCFTGDYLKTGRYELLPYSKNGEDVQVTGCRFGKASSGFQIRMYNKTLEMNKKTYKPWVKAAWDNAGFDDSQDTWRIEFEVHRKDFALVDKQTGEVINTMRSIQSITDESITNLFKTLYEKHFQFFKRVSTVKGKRVLNTDRKRRLRGFYPLDLGTCSYTKIGLSGATETGRSQRTELRKLVESYNTTKNFGTDLSYSIKQLIAIKVIKYQNSEWFCREFPDFIDFENLDIDLRTYDNEVKQTTLFNNEKCPTCHK